MSIIGALWAVLELFTGLAEGFGGYNENVGLGRCRLTGKGQIMASKKSRIKKVRSRKRKASKTVGPSMVPSHALLFAGATGHRAIHPAAAAKAAKIVEKMNRER